MVHRRIAESKRPEILDAEGLLCAGPRLLEVAYNVDHDIRLTGTLPTEH